MLLIYTGQPENPRNRDCQCFTDAKNRFYTSGARKHNGNCKGFYCTTLNRLIKIISCFSNHSSIKTNKMNHSALPSQCSCMAHSHFAVFLGGKSVENKEHLPCTLLLTSQLLPTSLRNTHGCRCSHQICTHTHTSSISLKCFKKHFKSALSPG